MSSGWTSRARFASFGAALIFGAVLTQAVFATSKTGSAPLALRVCADPNNLPFSNDRLEGFENALAAFVGGELDRNVQYAWRPQRRGFVRDTLNAGVCDVIMNVPASFDAVRTTRPYYRSTYVFVTRWDEKPAVESFDDPRLRSWRIGVPLTGDDYQNPPPALALARRGIVANLVGYTVYGDYSSPAPQAPIIDAVARREIDVAVVWGPIGGYFARHAASPLRVSPVEARPADAALPFAFDIAMGVRRDDEPLWRELDSLIARRDGAIRALLQGHGVPMKQGAPSPAATPIGPTPGDSPEPKLPTNPFARDRAAMAEGRKHFLHHNCVGCHGGRAGGGMGPSLRDHEWIYGGADAQIFSSIAQGRRDGMPAWGAMIAEDDIWRLVAYIKSLGTPAEPDAPTAERKHQ